MLSLYFRLVLVRFSHSRSYLFLIWVQICSLTILLLKCWSPAFTILGVSMSGLFGWGYSFTLYILFVIMTAILMKWSFYCSLWKFIRINIEGLNTWFLRNLLGHFFLNFIFINGLRPIVEIKWLARALSLILWHSSSLIWKFLFYWVHNFSY